MHYNLSLLKISKISKYKINYTKIGSIRENVSIRGVSIKACAMYLGPRL